MAEGNVHAGRCRCGDVRYEIQEPTVRSTICYCESCMSKFRNRFDHRDRSQWDFIDVTHPLEQ